MLYKKWKQIQMEMHSGVWVTSVRALVKPLYFQVALIIYISIFFFFLVIEDLIGETL
jgi:hypothetical protein